MLKSVPNAVAIIQGFILKQQALTAINTKADEHIFKV